jgi:N-acetylmuramoyl-L-alanine amidase CwlA
MNIVQKFHTPNKYSRSQKKLAKVKKVVIHYVGNAGSTAMGNWNYFESLKSGKSYTTKNGQKAYSYASAHYIVGLDGNIIYAIPENEIAYTSNSANSYSIGIEVCHPLWDGKFTDATYNALVELCADLCKRYGLNPTKDIIRHFDVTGKICPKYFVEHPEEFNIFKNKVSDLLNPKETELEKALKILSTKKINGDVIVNSPLYWEKVFKDKEVNLDYLQALIIKTSKYLEKI